MSMKILNVVEQNVFCHFLLLAFTQVQKWTTEINFLLFVQRDSVANLLPLFQKLQKSFVRNVVLNLINIKSGLKKLI